MKFRKKPVVIEAVQFVPGGHDLIESWMIGHDARDLFGVSDRKVQIKTLEGVMTAEPGDWIIRGVKGEFYPCRDDIFKATYEPVAPSTAPAQKTDQLAVAPWEDPDVQKVYEFLCRNEQSPDPEEHWEGWCARRIVALLRAPAQKPKIERLRELLSYNPDTGELRWRVSQGSVKPGKLAGTISSEGYRKLRVDRQFLAAHRIIWAITYGAWPEGVIDHINGVTDDNRLSNLRVATTMQNQYNRSKKPRNKSGFRGVTQRQNKWVGNIKAGGKGQTLGSFNTPEEASAAVEAAARELHGEFYRDPARS